MSTKGQCHLLALFQIHPAGDVTRVSVKPRIGVGDAEITVDEKGQTFLFRLVLSRVPFKSGV